MISSQLLVSLISIRQFYSFVSLHLSKMTTDWFYIISRTVHLGDGQAHPDTSATSQQRVSRTRYVLRKWMCGIGGYK